MVTAFSSIDGDKGDPIRVTTGVLAAMLCLAFVLNVVWFTSVAAIPLPASDAWHFLEVFVVPAIDGSLTPAHFFDQRSSDDHAQPLQRLILWLHLHYAQLDFGVEALVGVMLAVVTTALLGTLLLRGRQDDSPMQCGYRLLGICALFSIALSLNSTNLYTWSLVTLGWVLVLVALVYWLGLARIRRLPQLALYALAASFLMAMVVDELAFPVLVAAVIAVAIRDGARRPGCAVVIATAGAVGVALARLSLQVLSPGASVPPVGGGSALILLDVVRSADAWRLLVGPLSDSLVHRLHLQGLEPSLASAVQWALALALGIAHLGFWWRALVSRRLPSGEITVVALAFMLLFYATVAGIALSRVSMFGIEYVHQPRYVMMYQLNIIALVLMFFAPRDRAGESIRARSRFRAVAGVCALLLIGLQLPLSIAAWASARYLPSYVLRSDENLQQLALDPDTRPAGGCTDILTICDATVASREMLMAMLQENKLNLYSPAFRTLHHLDPLQDEVQMRASRENSARACSNAAVAWGPRSLVLGESFNTQPDGRSAYWVKLNPEVDNFKLTLEGKPVAFDRQEDTISFLHDPDWTAGVEPKSVLKFEIQCAMGGASSFEVEVLTPGSRGGAIAPR